MRAGFPLLFVIVAVGGLACERRLTAPAATSAPAPATAQRSESSPTKDELLDYLDGKEIVLTETPGKDGPKHVVRKNQVEALKVGSGASVNNGPWSTEIDFLLNAGEARYAVLARVEHKLIEDKWAFFGLTIVRVARQ